MTCPYCGGIGCPMCRERITPPGLAPALPPGLVRRPGFTPASAEEMARLFNPKFGNPAQEPQGSPGRPIPPELDWVVDWLKQALLCKIGPSGELLVHPPHTGAEFVEFIASAIEHGREMERSKGVANEEAGSLFEMPQEATKMPERERFDMLEIE